MPITTMDRLFFNDYLWKFLNQRVEGLDEDMASEDEDEIRNDSDAVVARLFEKYSLEPVRVDKDKTHIERQEYGQRHRTLTFSFSIPFTGSKELLEHYPDLYATEPVYGSISDGRIVVDIENAAGNTESFGREFDSWYANMEKLLAVANNQAKHFLDSLQNEIQSGIGERAHAIRSADDVVSALGYVEMRAAGEHGAEPTGDALESGHAAHLKIPDREDMHNEFKETFGVTTKGGKANDVKMEAAIAVAAFANAEGGRLYIGVNDDGEPVGLKDLKQYKNQDGLESAIRSYLKDVLKPRVDIELTFRDDWLVVEVRKHRENRWVYIGDGDFYVRMGNRSESLNPRETSEYQRDRTV